MPVSIALKMHNYEALHKSTCLVVGKCGTQISGGGYWPRIEKKGKNEKNIEKITLLFIYEILWIVYMSTTYLTDFFCFYTFSLFLRNQYLSYVLFLLGLFFLLYFVLFLLKNFSYFIFPKSTLSFFHFHSSLPLCFFLSFIVTWISSFTLFFFFFLLLNFQINLVCTFCAFLSFSLFLIIIFIFPCGFINYATLPMVFEPKA